MRIVRRAARNMAVMGLLLVAGACNAGSLQGGAEYGPSAETYVKAAARGDFSAVQEMSATPVPVEWIRLAARKEPELLQTAAREGLSPLGKTVRNDTVFVRFGFPYQGRTEVLSFRFIQRDNVRLITNVALPERI